MGKLTSKALWILLSDGGAKLFGFLSTIYLARVLGVEQFGLLTIAISVLGICGWMTDMGINTYATRAVAAGNARMNDFLWLKVFLSIGVVLISASMVWLLIAEQPLLRNLILLFLLSLIPQAFQIDWYFNGTQNFKWITLSRWIHSGTYLGLLLLFVTTDDLLSVPVLYTISIGLGAVTLLLCYRNEQKLLQFPTIENWKKIIPASIKIGGGSFLSQFVILLPPIIIGWFFGEESAGLYGVALKLLLLVMLVDKMFGTLLLPNLTIEWNSQKNRLSHHITMVIHWMFFVGAIGSFFLIFNTEMLISFLFGSSYTDAAILLQILALFVPVTFINTIFCFGLISIGRDREYFRAAVTGSAITVMFLFVSGLSGNLPLMVAAVVLSELILSGLMFTQLKKQILLPKIVRTLFLYTILFLSVLAISWFIPLLPFLQFLISITLFIVLCTIFRLIGTDEIKWLKLRVTE